MAISYARYPLHWTQETTQFQQGKEEILGVGETPGRYPDDIWKHTGTIRPGIYHRATTRIVWKRLKALEMSMMLKNESIFSQQSW